MLTAIRYLTSGSRQAPPRIAILVPGYGALAREIALRLQAAGIRYNDYIGRNAPPTPEEQKWKAWLAVQQEPRIAQVVRALEDKLLATDEETELRVRAQLEESFQRILSDHVEVLSAAAADAGEGCRWPDLASLWDKIVLLPEKASWNAMAEAAEHSLQAVGLSDWAGGLGELVQDIEPYLPGPVSRSTFLGWLAEHYAVSHWCRPAEQVVPYARVHLLPYHLAAWQEWTHLICTGLNQDLWPAVSAPRPYLPDARIAELNQSCQAWGSQGEGQLIVKDAHSYLLSTHDEQVLSRRLFATLVEECGNRLCVTCSRTDERSPSRRRIPGDLLSAMYLICRGRPLTEAEVDRLQQYSDDFRSQSTLPGAEVKRESSALPDVARTAEAHQRRRDMHRPYDEFGFCLKRAPESPLKLHCKEWEEALQHPPLVWLRKVLGVRPLPVSLEVENWGVTVGTLVHEWLAAAVRDYRRKAAHGPRAAAALLPQWVRKAHDRNLEWLQQLYRSTGRILPAAVRWTWRLARELAVEMARQVETRLADWPQAFPEWILPEHAAWTAPDKRKLFLSGRIDLLLERADARGQVEYWVVDFKTGSERKPLTAARLLSALRKGEGLQPVLYAMALPAAAQIWISILQAGSALDEQVSLQDALQHTEIFQELIRMQDTGIFGMRGEVSSEYAYSPEYPLATLPVPAEILKQKWQLTHPPLSAGVKESEQTTDE